jgi:dolichyl-phosphate-mannose-protein mannosyltransferase
MTCYATSTTGGTPRPDRRFAPALVLLLALSAVIHLPWLDHPPSVVFDEVHFGSYATAYCCNHQYFFDIHPPHAKLLIAGVARLFGYAGDASFASIGTPFGLVPAFPLRLLPAVAGTLLPALAFLLLRQLGATSAAAFLGGLLVAFDNAIALQSRLIVLDVMLLAFVLGALVAYFAAEDAATPGSKDRWSFLSGCLAGLAVGSKFLGLGVVALLGLCLLVQAARNPGRAGIAGLMRQSAWMTLGAAVVYLAGWMLHFELLALPGPGDIWGRPSGALVTDVVEIHRRMLGANIGLTHTHPDASPWWSWPLMQKPIFYWAAADSTAKLYLVGNPVVWLGGSLAFVVALVHMALMPNARLRNAMAASGAKARFWLPLAAYFVFYVPLVAVTRALFTYHYFAPLLFSLIVAVLWLDHIGWIRPTRLAAQRASYYAVAGLVVLGFVAMSPVTYATRTGAGITAAIFRVFPGWP